MTLVNTIYRAIGRRSSTWLLTIVTAGVVFEVVFDKGIESLYENMNRGKIWKDVKLTLPAREEEE